MPVPEKEARSLRTALFCCRCYDMASKPFRASAKRNCIPDFLVGSGSFWRMFRSIPLYALKVKRITATVDCSNSPCRFKKAVFFLQKGGINMKKLLLTLMTVCFLSACSYTHMPTINKIDLSEVDFSRQRIREEESCGYRILGLFGPFGDAKFIKAIRYAGISKVVGMDTNYKNFLLFQKECFRVYGY